MLAVSQIIIGKYEQILEEVLNIEAENNMAEEECKNLKSLP